MSLLTRLKRYVRWLGGYAQPKSFPEEVLNRPLPSPNERSLLGGFHTLKPKFVYYRDIYDTFFYEAPLRVAYAKDKYNLDRKRVLDVGCNFGQALIHFGEGSVGLELDISIIQTSKSMGIENIVQCDVEKDQWPIKDSVFDAVYCSNLLEHALSPYLLLRKAYNALKPGGLLFVGVPLIPRHKWTEKLIGWLFGLGYAQKFHLNAYTRRVLCFAVERAGFEVIECGVFVPWLRSFNRVLAPVLADLSCQAMCVAKKIEGRRTPNPSVELITPMPKVGVA